MFCHLFERIGSFCWGKILPTWPPNQKFGKFSMKCLNQFLGCVCCWLFFWDWYHGKSPIFQSSKPPSGQNIFLELVPSILLSTSKLVFSHENTILQLLWANYIPTFHWHLGPMVVDCKGVLLPKCRNTWRSGSKYKALLRDHDELHSPFFKAGYVLGMGVALGGGPLRFPW